MHLKGFIDVEEPKVTQGAKERLSDLLADWKIYEIERNNIVETEMANYNKLYKALGLPAIILKE